MSGLTDYSAQQYLNHISGQLAANALPAIYVGLFTTAPTSDAGVTGATEVSGGSYARQQVAGNGTTNGATASGNPTLHFASTPAWVVSGMSIRNVTNPATIPANTTVSGAPSGTTVTMSANAAGSGVSSSDVIVFSAFAPAAASSGSEPSTSPASTSNTNATITFPQATADWGTVTSFGLFDAVSSGNCLAWDYMGNFQWLPFSGTNASPSVLSSPAHGISNGDKVAVTAKYSGTLPATGGSWAGLLTVANSTTDTFTAGVNSTGTGDGQVRKITQQSIPINVTASFGTGTLTLKLA